MMDVLQKAKRVLTVKNKLEELQEKKKFIKNRRGDGKRLELVVTKQGYSTLGDGHVMPIEQSTIKDIVVMVIVDLDIKIRDTEKELHNLLAK